MSRDPETVSQSWREMITDAETGVAGQGQVGEGSTVLVGSILISSCGFKHRMFRKALTAVSSSEGRSANTGGLPGKVLCESRGRKTKTTWVSLEVMGMADGMDLRTIICSMLFFLWG